MRITFFFELLFWSSECDFGNVDKHSSWSLCNFSLTFFFFCFISLSVCLAKSLYLPLFDSVENTSILCCNYWLNFIYFFFFNDENVQRFLSLSIKCINFVVGLFALVCLHNTSTLFNFSFLSWQCVYELDIDIDTMDFYFNFCSIFNFIFLNVFY